jgi:hypothetical protein
MRVTLKDTTAKEFGYHYHQPLNQSTMPWLIEAMSPCNRFLSKPEGVLALTALLELEHCINAC